jgi:hypothetical protein
MHEKGREKAMSIKKILKAVVICGALAALAVGCTSTNHLDRYRFSGAPMAADLRTPPQPTIDVHYRVIVSANDPVGTVLSIGTSYGKAQEAAKAEEKMREALASVDLPGIILRGASSACADTLRARLVEHQSDADYLLDLEIERYGLHAGSSGGSVSMRINLNTRLHSLRDGELVWRRDLHLDRPLSPGLFGDGVVGNIVSAGVLASLTTEQLATGFRRLAEDTAVWVGRTLEDDYLAVRGR